MVDYVRCRGCNTIHGEGKLSYEWIPDTINLRASCSECACERFEPVSDICNDCEKREAMPGDDLCMHCRDAEDEKDFDAEVCHARATVSRQVWDREMLIDILTAATGQAR